jgi:flagellar basal-body rod protein FlgG
MQRIFWTSKSAMIANSEKMDVISNNIANVNTDGYKKIDVSFKDLISESMDRRGYPISKDKYGKNLSYTGTGIKTSDWVRDNTQGDLKETDQKSDFAIDGQGYFGVTDQNNATKYVRAGSFDVDGNGKLVDSNGNRLNIDFDKGYNYDNVKFSKSNYTVNDAGDVIVANGVISNKVGRIPLYNAVGDKAFSSLGENYYGLNSGAAVYKVAPADASIKQGFTENSNVDIGEEMSQMIITQRAFELGSKGIKTADDMWGMANNLRSK